MLPEALKEYLYRWPYTDLGSHGSWRSSPEGRFLVRELPEAPSGVAKDSRWPAFFPSPIAIVTAQARGRTALDKVVGPSVVNRFPYVLALNFCTTGLSARHHARTQMTQTLEQGEGVAVQFLPPGGPLNRVMDAITSTGDEATAQRIESTGLTTHRALTNDAPVFEDAYLVYEGRLVEPGRDFDGRDIFARPFTDVGSHRLYYFEINAIQLRRDIADGKSQIAWRSLPGWSPREPFGYRPPENVEAFERLKYQKSYTPAYRFPAAGTAAFSPYEIEGNMAVMELAPLPAGKLKIGNDESRWPCFFPSSLGMITSWAEGGIPSVMPCGSTFMAGRHPLALAAAICYADLNERYYPRASLTHIRRTGSFGCGVPFIGEGVIDAVKYSGNVSFRRDPQKLRNSGLAVMPSDRGPVLAALPVHFDCEVVEEVRLGTHSLFLGEVKRILVRSDVEPGNPLKWCPWAAVDGAR